MKSTLRQLACATLLALLPAVAAQADDIQTRTIRFAFENQRGHPQAEGADKFAELVAAKSGGKLTVKTFPGGVLGGNLQNVSAVQGGTLEMTNLNAGILTSHVKELGVFDTPFLFNNAEEVDAITDGPIGTALLEKLSEKGIIGLGYWDLGFRHLTNNRRPVEKVEDIAGLKVRVIQSPIYIDLFNALGANALPLAFPELYPALESHAVDGQENPFTTILASNFQEVQKYVTRTGHLYNPMALIISKRFWDKLSAEEQRILREAAAEASLYQRERSRAGAEAALQALQDGGMQLTELSPQEMERFRAAVAPVVSQHAQRVGPETLEQVQAELAKLRNPS